MTVMTKDITVNSITRAQKFTNLVAGVKNTVINLDKNNLIKGVTVEGAGQALGALSLTYNLVKFGEDPSAGKLLETVISGVSLIPGWGWAIGARYFFTDLVVKGITDKSIAQHIDGE
jgi:hypothetical protein